MSFICNVCYVYDLPRIFALYIIRNFRYANAKVTKSILFQYIESPAEEAKATKWKSFWSNF